jgi:thymidylate synthase
LTTKEIDYHKAVREMLFFLSGKTDTKILEAQGVNFWKGNTSAMYLMEHKLEHDTPPVPIELDEKEKEQIAKLNTSLAKKNVALIPTLKVAAKKVPYTEGDMGPSYGFQWRHWNAPYYGCQHDYTGQGIDQWKNLLQGLKTDPFGRRHIITSWNPEQLAQMALPPCHMVAEFYVSSDRKHLDCMLFQRSADLFLGVPHNIASYVTLMYIIGKLTNLKPRKFTHAMGDAHIYVNLVRQCETQIRRTPRPWPRIKVEGNQENVEDFRPDHFMLHDYHAWPFIAGKMAV